MSGNNPIYGKQIYQTDGALEKLEADLLRIDTNMRKVETSANSLMNTTKKMNSTNKQQRETIKESAQQADKLSQEHKKLKQSYSNTAVEIKKIEAVRKRQNQIQKLEIQLAKSAEGSYNQLSAKYSLIKIKLNAMSKAQRESTVAGRAMVAQSKELYTQMNNLQKATGKNQLNVGNYGAGAKQAAGSLLGFASGVGAAILVTRKLSQAVKEAVTVWTDYDKATSKVRAISGATGEQMKMLSKQAEDLGASTEKTASEVSQLQLELAKLGFDPKQIQDATGSILDMSTAIDADLAQSATVVGQTLRAFNLDASETQRVTDVMAASFSKSSLDLSKFQSAMSTVAPVAKTFGFNVEETTALLAQLTDAGFDASSAGTALRNILLNLADSNGDLAQALGGSVTNADELLDGLDKLSAQGVDLNETLQLTDKRSVAAFNRFLGATDSTRKLTKELEASAGAAARMANIMRDNLAGDADKAKSAMQGLYINIGKRLNPSLREGVQAVTNFVGKLSKIAEIDAAEQLMKEREEVIQLTGRLQDANLSYEDRLIVIDKLKQIAPDVVEGINAEEIAYSDLNKQLDNYLEKVIEKIAIAKLEIEQEKLLTDIADIRLKQLETMDNAYEVLIGVSDKYRVTEGSRQEQIKGTLKLLAQNIDVNAALNGSLISVNSRTGTVSDARSKEQKQYASLIALLSNYNRKENEISKIEKDKLDRLNERIAAYKKEFGVVEEKIKKDEEDGETTEKKKKGEIDYTNTIKGLRIQLSKLKDEKETLSLDDEAAITAKRVEIDTLEELIKTYEALGEVIQIDAQAPNEMDIPDDNITVNGTFDYSGFDASILAEIQAGHKAMQDLEQQNSDNLLGIFSKYLTLRNAKRENMNAEEIAAEKEKNEKIAEGLSTATEYAIDQLSQLFDYQMEIAEQEYEVAQRKVDVTWNELEAEISAREQGLANNVATKQKEYEADKKREEKALKDKQKAAKQQQNIDSITQASSLITASANIWSSMSSIPVIGSVLAIAAIALMWGSFAYSKSKASQATSYGKGGTFDIGGGTHSSGNDTSLGTHNGVERKVEKGEKVGVIKATAVRNYGRSTIDDIINSINKGTFESTFSKGIVGERDMPAHMLFNAGHDTADLRDLESNVKKIRKQGDERWYTNSRGQQVRVYKNLKQTFID